jgi:hypothetical protein
VPLPDPVVQDFEGVRRNFIALSGMLSWGSGAPTHAPARVGSIYVNEDTGDMYVRKTDGWHPVTVGAVLP